MNVKTAVSFIASIKGISCYQFQETTQISSDFKVACNISFLMN